MSDFLMYAIYYSLTVLALAGLVATVRIIIGPAAQDRVIALDCLYICGMLILVVLGIRYGHHLYFDAALLIALFGFVGSMCVAKFLLRGEVIE